MPRAQGSAEAAQGGSNYPRCQVRLWAYLTYTLIAPEKVIPRVGRGKRSAPAEKRYQASPNFFVI